MIIWSLLIFSFIHLEDETNFGSELSNNVVDDNDNDDDNDDDNDSGGDSSCL